MLILSVSLKITAYAQCKRNDRALTLAKTNIFLQNIIIIIKNKQSKTGAKKSHSCLPLYCIMLCVSGIRSMGRNKGSENSEA